MKIDGYDDAGENIEDFSPYYHTFRDINLSGAKSFGDRTPIVLDPRIRQVNVEIERVVFVDGSIWQFSGLKITPPQQKPIKNIAIDLQDQLKRDVEANSAIELNQILYFPLKQKDYWLCQCGRPNTNQAVNCTRCGFDKNSIFDLINFDNLEKNLTNYKESLRLAEEERVRRLIEKKANNKKRIKTFSYIVVTLLIIGAIFALVFPKTSPGKYMKASNLLGNKQYDDAMMIFKDLGNYRDSSELLKDANYQKANDLLADKQFDEAIAIFTLLGNYKNSANYINETNYQKANDLLQRKEFDDAIEIFGRLAGYKDSEELVKETNYQKARVYILNGQYDDAIGILSILKDFTDRDNLLVEAKYQKAKVYLTNKQFDEAIEILSTLTNYDIAIDLLQEAKYQNANDLLKKENYSEAVNILEGLGDYKDSKILFTKNAYNYAVMLFNANNFKASENYLNKIGEYGIKQNYLDKIRLLRGISNGLWTYKSGSVNLWLRIFDKVMIDDMNTLRTYYYTFTPTFNSTNSLLYFTVNSHDYKYDGYSLVDTTAQRIFIFKPY